MQDARRKNSKLTRHSHKLAGWCLAAQRQGAGTEHAPALPRAPVALHPSAEALLLDNRRKSLTTSFRALQTLRARRRNVAWDGQLHTVPEPAVKGARRANQSNVGQEISATLLDDATVERL